MSMADLSIAGHSGGEVLFLLAAAFIAGFARGFSGFGAALIFMPLASSVIGPQSSAPLLLIIDAVAALGLLPRGWLLADRPSVGTMTLGALVGVPLGTYALARMDPLTLRWSIVLLVVLLLGLLMSGWRYHGRPATPLTIGVGGLAGFFSGAAQVGGPPVVAYWLGGGGNGVVVRANIVLYFAISSALTGASYLAGGLITRPVLVLALVTGPFYGFGLYLGSLVFGQTSERGYRWACYGLIAMASIVSLPVLDPILGR
ncbi:sulfite exporter TauE/SafE family protein [Mesorhizobium loti]|uniref:sulfite exporter TauE/SafE family protein n=1 Tax=Rhizobium loti TaxID=381 RepID=UPI00047C0308